jgi:hypothetical protein
MLAIVPVATRSKWWIIAMLLPVSNFLFVIAIVVIGEWMASGH